MSWKEEGDKKGERGMWVEKRKTEEGGGERRILHHKEFKKTTANFSVATPESPPHQQVILMSHKKIKWAENSIKKIGDSCYLIVQTAHT